MNIDESVNPEQFNSHKRSRKESKSQTDESAKRRGRRANGLGAPWIWKRRWVINRKQQKVDPTRGSRPKPNGCWPYWYWKTVVPDYSKVCLINCNDHNAQYSLRIPLLFKIWPTDGPRVSSTPMIMLMSKEGSEFSSILHHIRVVQPNRKNDHLPSSRSVKDY